MSNTTHQINETHVGTSATAEDAKHLAVILTRMGYPSEYNPMQGVSSDIADENGEAVEIPQSMWDKALTSAFAPAASDVTHPLPGATKWTPGMTRARAMAIACEHYDVTDIGPSVDGSWGILTRSGWSAIVGIHEGAEWLLTKDPDGGRTLIRVSQPDPSAAFAPVS